MELNDHQIGGNHYKVMKIEPVTFIIENDKIYKLLAE